MKANNYAVRYLNNLVIAALLKQMHECRALTLSFDECLAEARKQFNREVNKEALKQPLPTK